MELTRYTNRHPGEVEAVQFNELDDYLAIFKFMRDGGDTHAMADEVYFSTPEMSLYTDGGRFTLRPGDWVLRRPNGQFYGMREAEFQSVYKRST